MRPYQNEISKLNGDLFTDIEYFLEDVNSMYIIGLDVLLENLQSIDHSCQFKPRC